VANTLTASGNRISSNPDQQVLFRANRGEVVISAYGFTEPQSQERLLADLRGNLRDKTKNIKVRVFFFPPRVLSVETRFHGMKVSTLKEMPAIREVQLN
jgi:hypothetical protein